MSKRKTSIEREQRLVTKMIELYCRHHHTETEGGLCPECSKLANYALNRLEKCPLGQNKDTCRKCKIHCYSPAMRLQIKKVMRYSGPRMLFYAPIETLKHIL